jgi:hypothetical protein
VGCACRWVVFLFVFLSLNIFVTIFCSLFCTGCIAFGFTLSSRTNVVAILLTQCLLGFGQAALMPALLGTYFIYDYFYYKIITLYVYFFYQVIYQRLDRMTLGLWVQLCFLFALLVSWTMFIFNGILSLLICLCCCVRGCSMYHFFCDYLTCNWSAVFLPPFGWSVWSDVYLEHRWHFEQN